MVGKQFETGYNACGSPNCFYIQHKGEIGMVLNNMSALEEETLEERRHMAYIHEIEIVYDEYDFR